MSISNLFLALRQGYILKNAESWKNRTVAVNALTALIGVLAALAKEFGYGIPVSDEMAVAIATGVWGVVGVFNAWSTVATTDKIGLRPKAVPAGVDEPPSRTGDPV